MGYQLLGFPWFVWILFVLGVAYIGLILWFCQYGSTQSFNKKTHRYCSIIIFATIFLILTNILAIALIL